MNSLKLAYCNECEDLVNFSAHDEIVEEVFKGERIRYRFNVARCNECGCEVAADLDYEFRKSRAKIEAYKKKKSEE